MMKKNTVLIIVPLIAVAALAVAFWKTRDAARTDGEPSEGAPMASDAGSVRLTRDQVQQFGIETAEAGPGALRVEVVFPGEIAMNADRVAHVVPRVSGIVREVRKNLGDTVKRGEIMAVLESRELAEASSTLLAARERVKLAQASCDREEMLWKKRISPQQDYLQARNALAEMEIALRSAEQTIRSFGFSDDSISKLTDRLGQTALLYEMVAPYDSTIIEKHISLGEVLKEESPAFVVADLTSVWVNLDVHQKDLPHVRVGQRATIGIGSGGAGAGAEGRIGFLEPIAEETNRTIHARVVLDNAGGKWRPGMFVTGRIEVEEARIPVLVPNEALLLYSGKTCVFVKDGDSYRIREIVAGRADGNSTEVIRGLDAGQLYVAKGAFTLKSELGKPAEEE